MAKKQQQKNKKKKTKKKQKTEKKNHQQQKKKNKKQKQNKKKKKRCLCHKQPCHQVNVVYANVVTWVWEGLRFVIVALPGPFSYLFCFEKVKENNNNNKQSTSQVFLSLVLIDHIIIPRTNIYCT